ncbi:glycosyltransferase [Dehalobacter sp.]|uniref:glycosyltransferase n=1 Tax=Dehalobacter sp. TaxID=1962289 RepID=UPI002590C5D1|nr:glycosyltransferase [Dehalobacter sp.]MDJ0304953.1 glycosyltransferase [Dehalobacter sp.]
MNRQIVIVGEFRFPEGDASAIRILNIAKALRDTGDHVHIIGTGVPGMQDKTDGTYRHQGFSYETINTESTSKFKKVMNLLTRSLTAAARIKRLYQHKKIDVVMIAVGYGRFVGPVLHLSRKLGFKVVIDVVEWYDPDHLPFGKWGPFNWDVQLGLRFLFKKARNIIAISTFLEKYYLDADCNVVRIPPMVDLEEKEWCCLDASVKAGKHRKIIYAGNPGAKDLLLELIKSLYSLKINGLYLDMDIYGVDISWLKAMFGVEAHILDELEEQIKAYGRVSHSEVIQAVKNSMFSVLVRPDKRYANAGFPTKVVESLAAGTPVILNYTSDLSLYIQDGIEGLIIKECSSSEITTTLERAINLPEHQLNEMRKSARMKAEACFDYRVYIPILDEFLNSLL